MIVQCFLNLKMILHYHTYIQAYSTSDLQALQPHYQEHNKRKQEQLGLLP